MTSNGPEMLYFRAVILYRSSIQVFHFLVRVRNDLKNYTKKILFVSIELFKSGDKQMLMNVMEAAFSIWAGRKTLISQKNNRKKSSPNRIYIYLFIYHIP